MCRHFDVTGKHCPSYLVGEKAWDKFKERLVEPPSVPAQDNVPGKAHREGVAWAVEQGILRGTGAGDLMLSRPVTREQMATMLYRFSKWNET